MSEFVIYKSLIVGVALCALFIAERCLPAVTAPAVVASGHRVIKNLSLWAVNSLISPLIVLPITLYAIEVEASWRTFWPGGWLGLVLDILLLDCWIYWWHRANHRLPFLWRFHQVHHLDQWLDVTSALRFHFGEVILSALIRAVVIICLGLPWVSVVVFEVLVLVCAGFHHSNLRLPPRLEQLLSWLIVTPSIHWVHHHAIQQDTDSNYGTVFSFWDRLFGSVSSGRRLNSMTIGVEGEKDRSLGQLMLKPFGST